MRKPTCVVLLLLAALVFWPTRSEATITFTQLDDDVFVVSHRVKVIGSRGKAMKMVYTKAASLCVAAGYTHYRILDQESQASQQYEAANASARVQYFLGDGDDRIGCDNSADPEYVREAGNKLRKRGYTPPEPQTASEGAPAAPAEAPETKGEEMSCPGGCTLEQIAAMARSGLTDQQIRAACAGG